MKPCLFAAAALFAFQSMASASAIFQTLGDQDFSDGTIVTSGTFLAAGAGEPAPFDGAAIGADGAGPNFSASWIFNSYGGVILNPILSATLTLGIWDADSAATGSQISSFTLGATDLTSLLDTQFEANQGTNNMVRVYTITLPGAAFAQLATGSATFALALKGPGLGVLGNTTFNGAALDFSTLAISVQDPVPEPATVSLMLAGLAALAGCAQLRTRRK